MANSQPATEPLITGLHHINLTIPHGTLDQAKSFYATTLGLTSRPVPAAQTRESHPSPATILLIFALRNLSQDTSPRHPSQVTH